MKIVYDDTVVHIKDGDKTLYTLREYGPNANLRARALAEKLQASLNARLEEEAETTVNVEGIELTDDTVVLVHGDVEIPEDTPGTFIITTAPFEELDDVGLSALAEKAIDAYNNLTGEEVRITA